jgi:hypothetical protein
MEYVVQDVNRTAAISAVRFLVAPKVTVMFTTQGFGILVIDL